MEQFVLLLVIAAISLINWLIDRSAKLREQRRLQKESANRNEPDSFEEPPVHEASAREELEEHMRRVMESFGMPVEEPKIDRCAESSGAPSGPSAALRRR